MREPDTTDSPRTPRFRRAPLWTPSHHRLERLALSLELLPHNLDVFHTTDFIPPQFGARRHVITVHDLTFLHYPQFLTDESRRYYNDQIALCRPARRSHPDRQRSQQARHDRDARRTGRENHRASARR